jgi:RNA polymerase sigma factor (TIGR02999 family)
MNDHLDGTREEPTDDTDRDGAPDRARGTLDRDMEAHYDSLRDIARRAVERVPGGRALDPTELLHEGYLKLQKSEAALPPRRTEFLALAAKVLRNCLVDHVRELRTQKRGGDLRRITLTGIERSTDGDVDLLELDDALRRLAALDPQQGQVVELKYFGGLSFEEIADLLELSVRTVKADWTLAKAWLHRELCG